MLGNYNISTQQIDPRRIRWIPIGVSLHSLTPPAVAIQLHNSAPSTNSAAAVLVDLNYIVDCAQGVATENNYLVYLIGTIISKVKDRERLLQLFWCRFPFNFFFFGQNSQKRNIIKWCNTQSVNRCWWRFLSLLPYQSVRGQVQWEGNGYCRPFEMKWNGKCINMIGVPTVR